MEHFIIGTAGHVDHGKTALIRGLTGRETDNLKEEKERGISIDLGFTYMELSDGSRAGIIDVPGHEKFLTNMVAGVCGMDMVLLVIALDEGIMPQTEEHLEIIRLLGVGRGIIVLTKSDLVEEQWADMMEKEIRTGLPDICHSWEMLRVSAKNGQGIDKLKQIIEKELGTVVHNRNVSGRFRMPIDRVIPVKGMGTVVAGTMLEGVAHTGDELMLYPSGMRSRIKGIQLHGEEADRGCAGERVAMLLANVKKEEVKRGFVAAYPDSITLSERLDVVITMSKSTERTVKNQSRVHLHIGTAHIICRVILMDAQSLAAGEKGYAQLVLEEPLAVRRGDRFVLRFFSPTETVGGGMVLHPAAVKHKRLDKDILEQFANLEHNQADRILLETMRTDGKMLTLEELEQRGGYAQGGCMDDLEALVRENRCIRIDGRAENYYLSIEGEERLREHTRAGMKRYHEKYPFREGTPKSYPVSEVLRNLAPERADAFLGYLLSMGCLKQRDGLWSDSEFEVVCEGKLDKLRKRFRKNLGKAGFDFVKIDELCPEGMDMQQYMDGVRYLEKHGKIVKISDDFYTLPELAEEIRFKVEEYFTENEILSFASLRDLLGTSRRSAKPLMAYLDREKITAWCGKETERRRA